MPRTRQGLRTVKSNVDLNLTDSQRLLREQDLYDDVSAGRRRRTVITRHVDRLTVAHWGNVIGADVVSLWGR